MPGFPGHIPSGGEGERYPFNEGPLRNVSRELIELYPYYPVSQDTLIPVEVVQTTTYTESEWETSLLDNLFKRTLIPSPNLIEADNLAANTRATL